LVLPDAFRWMGRGETLRKPVESDSKLWIKGLKIKVVKPKIGTLARPICRTFEEE